MASPVSCFHPVACGENTGARLCPASCFFPVIYRVIQGRRHLLRRQIDTAYDGLSKGDDDLAGVYIQHALRVMRQ